MPRSFYGPYKIQMLHVSLTLFSLLVWKVLVSLGAAPALADGQNFLVELMGVDVCTFQGKPVKKKKKKIHFPPRHGKPWPFPGVSPPQAAKQRHEVPLPNLGNSPRAPGERHPALPAGCIHGEQGARI